MKKTRKQTQAVPTVAEETYSVDGLNSLAYEWLTTAPLSNHQPKENQ